MASTKNKPASTAATPDWMSRIKESSHDVLLAGIGALARAQGRAETRQGRQVGQEHRRRLRDPGLRGAQA